MIGNIFGSLFRVSTFGESHGPALGAVIDGCPAGLELDLAHISRELQRRRPGQSSLVTQRKESDEFELLSGVYEGRTTGAPLAFIIRNEDVRSKDYDAIKDLFRPGHGDFTYFAKYRHRDHRGGGRSSARETAARVIAGAVAKQLLGAYAVTIRGAVVQVGPVKALQHRWDQVEHNELRALDPDRIEAMRAVIEAARKERDSVGGVVEVQALGVPPGLGEPVFGKLDAIVGGAMFSIPAVKGVEIGLGFAGAELCGSAFHDCLGPSGFASNRHGGILGGLSSGTPIVVRVAVKPTASIARPMKTLDRDMQEAEVETKGRHDPCVAIRAVPVAEAMLALVLIDALLQDAAARSVRDAFAPAPRLAPWPGASE